jgi:hypothetical protein
VALTKKQFRYSFGNALTEGESGELFDRWAIPGPGKPLFEASAANFKKSSPAAGQGRRRCQPLTVWGAWSGLACSCSSPWATRRRNERRVARARRVSTVSFRAWPAFPRGGR